MKPAWNARAGSVIEEVGHVVTQMELYGSLAEVLQPKHRDPTALSRRHTVHTVVKCLKNFSDVGELREASMHMAAGSTGGLRGVTRKHFLNAPDRVWEWVREMTK